MKKQLKSLLADYLKQVLSKPFSASEILDTYEIAVIYAYSEDRYEALNERLRKNLGQLDTDFGQELIRILEKLPNFEGVVYRGTSFNKQVLNDYLNAFDNDKILTEFALTSASKFESEAKKFMRSSKDAYQVLFKIISKEGKDITPYSKYQNEREILFKPNTQFEILSVDNSNDYVTITLNEIKNGSS